jgi:hypothetical protein
MAKPSLTAARLREVLHYDPATGVFRVKKATSRKQRIGAIAGSELRGYRKHRIDGVTHQAHRLAWLYVYGDWPKNCIDHINGIPGDNRIANLRDVSLSVNAENLRGARSRSSSGILGAFPRGNDRWVSQICVRGVVIYLGIFKTPECAHHAYLDAKRQYHEGNTL